MIGSPAPKRTKASRRSTILRFGTHFRNKLSLCLRRTKMSFLALLLLLKWWEGWKQVKYLHRLRLIKCLLEVAITTLPCLSQSPRQMLKVEWIIQDWGLTNSTTHEHKGTFKMPKIGLKRVNSQIWQLQWKLLIACFLMILIALMTDRFWITDKLDPNMAI